MIKRDGQNMFLIFAHYLFNVLHSGNHDNIANQQQVPFGLPLFFKND